MLVVTGADLVLPDRVVPGGTLIIDDGVIVGVEPRVAQPAGADVIDAAGLVVVPGLIDVHVHGVEGFDTLDGGQAIAEIAARLPRYGVTAFCPTTVACAPDALQAALDQVRRARLHRPESSARVLPAHLESNFISPEYRGAQPLACLRVPREAAAQMTGPQFRTPHVLAAMAAARADVGIVTIAPELDGGIDLVRSLVASGYRVSLGHSGADVEIAMAAIDAGARQATHLFNRMPPLAHRAPGLAGAVLAREEVTAELICDGVHVHPAMSRVAMAAKGAGRIMAITDGTAVSGLPVGSVARLGGQSIRAADHAAVLEDGTLAGSRQTMDRVFAHLVTDLGRSLVDAARMCATTPAQALGVEGLGRIGEGETADVVILDREFRVVRTFVDGNEVYAAR
jgi:N-acetylglucosamine-6-phosphate deacetylase